MEPLILRQFNNIVPGTNRSVTYGIEERNLPWDPYYSVKPRDYGWKNTQNFHEVDNPTFHRVHHLLFGQGE